jgi:hypothetical protein
LDLDELRKKAPGLYVVLVSHLKKAGVSYEETVISCILESIAPRVLSTMKTVECLESVEESEGS